MANTRVTLQDVELAMNTNITIALSSSKFGWKQLTYNPQCKTYMVIVKGTDWDGKRTGYFTETEKALDIYNSIIF